MIPQTVMYVLTGKSFQTGSGLSTPSSKVWGPPSSQDKYKLIRRHHLSKLPSLLNLCRMPHLGLAHFFNLRALSSLWTCMAFCWPPNTQPSLNLFS